jgi:hypothetical protein
MTVVRHGDIEALAAAMVALRDRLRHGERLPPLTVADREHLSWSSYARRYLDQLLTISLNNQEIGARQ